MPGLKFAYGAEPEFSYPIAEQSLSFEARWCAKCNSMAFHSELACVLLAQRWGGIFMCLPAKCHVNKCYGGNFQEYVMARCTRACCVSEMGYLPLVAYVFTICLRYLIAWCLEKKKKKKKRRWGIDSNPKGRPGHRNPALPHPVWPS